MDFQRSLTALNVSSFWRREMKVWGYRFKPPSLDRLVCLALHRVGLMGQADKMFLERHIRPGMIVVDIGANQGLYTLLFAKLVGTAGSVIAFEPEPNMFEALVHNCRNNSVSNVQMYNMALGSKRGIAALS